MRCDKAISNTFLYIQGFLIFVVKGVVTVYKVESQYPIKSIFTADFHFIQFG